MMRKLVILVLLLIVGAVPTLAQDASVAHLRIAHFSIDAGPVDVYVNGEAMFKELAFPDVTQWTEVAAGTYSIAVAPAGTSADGAIIGPMDVKLAADEWVTVATIGLKGNKTLALQPLVEDFSTIPQAMARVSMFHAITGLDPVNVLANDTVLVEQLGYPGFFGEESDGFTTSDVVAQAYDFSIQNTAGETLVDVGNLLLGANRNYLIAAVGLRANPQYVVVTSDLEALMAPQEEPVDLNSLDLGTGTLFARFGHFAAGTTAVDVYINGELSDVAGLEFAGLSDWEQLDAGVYNIAVAPAETSIDDAVLRQDVALETGATVTIAVIGTADLGNITLQLVQEDFSETEPGMARVGVFHAIADMLPVNLVVDDTILIQNLGYPGYFQGEGDGFHSVDIVAKEYDLKITLTDGTDVVDLGNLLLGDGRNYFIVLAGVSSDPVYVIERTDIVDLAQ